jgi:uncharacterized protein YecE (DUF72 family)
VKDIYIGTSGYNYEDWKNYFYPPDLDSKEYLHYYSGVFNTVELNFTYYCFPNPYTFFSLCRKVKESQNFIFSLKANSKFTHERDYNIDDSRKFLVSLKPLYEVDRLGSILFQFPYSFSFNENNLDYIKRIGEDFAGYNICVEFRNNSWLNDTMLENLKKLSVGFCNVDEPHLKGLIPATSICTTDTGYIRFHGRNSASWWEHEHAYQRYDYMYSQEELAEWIPKAKEITDGAKKTFIYFNNHYKGKAAKSALLFLDLLKSNNIYTSQN